MSVQDELDIKVTRPPLRYHGGKFRIAPWVIGHFPEHSCYAEVFGGGAGCLLRKPRSRTEHYNDLDQQVVNFFQVLRDPIQRLRLVELASLTPFARAEFDLAYEPTVDPVESARRFLFRTHAGHGTSSLDPTLSNGFRSRDLQAGKSYACEWAGVPQSILDAGIRLKGVTIECLHFREFIPRYNEANVLLYVDPPYCHSTRQMGGKSYVHEMSDLDHRELAWLLKRSSAKVVLSGYDCPLYRELYKGWKTDSTVTVANGQRGGVSRREWLWMNYD